MQKSLEQGREVSGPMDRSEMAGQMAVLIFFFVFFSMKNCQTDFHNDYINFHPDQQ